MGADDAIRNRPPADIVDAITVVEWWRGRHARPLAQVNAGLRHYIRKAGAEPEVTQRLKRFATIVHKLHRQPTMELTTMEDIGGVRAILPAQDQILARVLADTQGVSRLGLGEGQAADRGIRTTCTLISN